MNEKIKAMIAVEANISPDSISNDTILADLGLDSLDSVIISMAIEDEFEIEFGDQEMHQFIEPGFTFGDLVRLAEGKVQG